MKASVPIWTRGVSLRRFCRLERDLKADVAVIGAGMAGILTAHRLSEAGARVVVLEAKRVAGGQTRRTTAKLTSQHGMIYDALIQKFGAEKAGKYARANEAAIREYAEMISRLGIECGWRETCAYLYTKTADEPMRREAEAAASLGINASFTAETELPFRIRGAVRFGGQAMFSPLKLISPIIESLEIYEDTRVISVKGKSVITERGTVTADKVVFAAHYPFVNIPGWYFMRMHQERSYVLALKSNWLPRGMYYGADAGALSFREADGLLLAGGESHRTGENSTGGRYEALLRKAREAFPECEETARWSAQDCITADGIPYIGRYSRAEPDWYVATGFGKWGMSASMAAAMIICGDIIGKPPEWGDVFSPARFNLAAVSKNLKTEIVVSCKSLAREWLTFPKTALDSLPVGHGGIVMADGVKAGVYKDENGQCHIVSTRCPHLGCQLEWNPDELSWDCPCHGSRFGYDGKLIDNPAQKNIK